MSAKPDATDPIPLISRPGIQRDGTRFDTLAHVDGEWVRWQNGRPKKMGGYQQAERITPAGEIARGLYGHPRDNLLDIYIGSQGYLQELSINVNTGVATVPADRTPSGFAASANNAWQFDEIYDSDADLNYVIGHGAPNLLDIASDTEAPVYYGDDSDTSQFAEIMDAEVSGGIVALPPYLLAFGSNGRVKQSVAGKPLDFVSAGANDARVTTKKIVKGVVTRGGAGQSPAGLLWSLDTLIRATFIGGSPVFNYDPIANIDGVLGAQAMLEFDGVYYWPGQQRFQLFNGVVAELPNRMNKNFFYDNINLMYRNKTFGWKVPRYNELWWAFVKGSDATEPNWAVIYNTDERAWYDTPLPAALRACALNAPTYVYPILASATVDGDGLSALYRHEFGVDQVDGSPLSAKAIRSFYETGRLSAVAPAGPGPGTNRGLRAAWIEPDFTQVGDMTVQMTGGANARAADVTTAPKTFPAVPATKEEQLVYFKNTRRVMRFRFQSNVAGGDYFGGLPILHVGLADATVLGATEASEEA